MATVSAFSTTPRLICRTAACRRASTLSLTFPIRNLHFQTDVATNSFKRLAVKNNNRFHGLRKLRSVDEETLATEEQQDDAAESNVVEQGAQQPTVSVPVSPSDTLLMRFLAEGTLDEAAVPQVTKALEGVEGIGYLDVQVQDGIASVEISKETTIQATGVASSLIEIIQGSGFKLQTLNLSFEDEEDFAAAGTGAFAYGEEDYV